MNKKLFKTLYYVLNLTWGAVVSFIGSLIAIALLITGHKPHLHGGCIYFEVGEGWGGFEMGLFFFCSKNSSLHTKNHEFGHSIQTAVFGPFMLIVVSLPSCIRYWYRRIRTSKGLPNKTAYDDIWFEGSASKLGDKYISYWK